MCIAKNYNVVDFGARADGETDSSSAFIRAWTAACSSNEESTVYVPPGTFLVNTLSFNGGCKAKIQVKIYGVLVAPKSYKFFRNHQAWIAFYQVSRLSVVGGTIDARGSSFWECRRSKGSCPYGARVNSTFSLFFFITLFSVTICEI